MLTEENRVHYENYFQSNSDYYIDHMEKIDNGQKFTFNVAAFFLGILWMAYRKMYIHIVIIFGIIFLEMFIEDMLFDLGVISYEIYEVIDAISMLVWSFLLATLSNKLYISKSKKQVAKILNENNDIEERKKMFSKKGGVSSFAPFILILIIFTLVYISSI